MTLTQVSTGGIKDGQVHTADLADSQITAGKLHADALDHTYTLGASGSDHYTFTGEGLTGAVNDPTLYLTRGKTYRFVNGNSSGAHPFRIQSVAGAGGTEYNTGVTNNAGGGGSTIIFEVPHDAPDVLYYICTSHASMNGIFYVTGALADGTVTTAKLAADAVNGTKLADNAVGSEHITDQAVTLAKLPHGDGSSDGKFLRANNGADPTFETINTDLVADSSPQLGGALDTNGHNITLGDAGSGSDDRIVWGAGSDLQMYHNGTNSFIENQTGYLRITGFSGQVYVQSNDDVSITGHTADENMAVFHKNGAVELYHDNSKKLETTTSGIDVTGAITVNGSALASGLFSSYAVVTDQKSNGTDGGSFDNGAWRVRDINTEKFDPDGIVSISGNEITLVAGTYYIEVAAPAYGVTRHMAKIYSISSPSEDWYGENAFAHGSHYATTHSFVRARIACSTARTIGIAHRCETSRGTTGFGIACGFGNVETYTIVKIFKEA